MANELTFIFTQSNIQTLLDKNPDYVVVKSFIEEATLLNNDKAGVVRVKAEAIRAGSSTPLATVSGCPNPPCDTNE